MIVALLCVSAIAMTTSASIGHASGVTSALPAGATLGAEVAIAGERHDYAVTYFANGWDIGVVMSRGETDSLIWHEKVTGTPVALDSPEPLLFRIESRAPGPDRGGVYAYTLKSGAVESAIAGAASGHLTSQEYVVKHPNGFTVRARDLGHDGSVRYRIDRTYVWNGGAYRLARTFRQPDYAVSAYPTPSAWTTTRNGNTILIKLEVADTEAQRELGLMYSNSLDPDAGMIFVWQSPVLESFWMENTPIPLSIAWLGPDGTVQEMQDMQPETVTYHTPAQPYLYAIEANLGFFQQNGIEVGDRFHLELTGQSVH
jgi:uncharacterized membrane protein (UPF0127 family)